MTEDCPAGTDLAERLVIKYPSLVCLRGIAVRMRPVGSAESTLLWLMALYNAKFAFIGRLAAARGQLTSVFVIVEDFLFTNFIDHRFALSVTVATD